jgi:23S rRNA A1618 N6-methylase RlmF
MAAPRKRAREEAEAAGGGDGGGGGDAEEFGQGDDDEMHPRNPYHGRPPDFADLARSFPALAPHLRGGGARPSLHWERPAALLALTTALLKRDFGVEFALPPGHLCPPLPQRLNYLLWVADLLECPARCERLRGVDVGTGASAIFALLGRAFLGWRVLATEVDGESVAAARELVARNGMEAAIEVRQVPERRMLLRGVLREEDGAFDFVVCNPPFFASLSEAGRNAARGTEATASELACEGGEEAFVGQMVRESASPELRDRVRWFTSMLGKKASLSPLRAALAAAGATRVLDTSMRQGAQTRWALAWTFDASQLAGAPVRFVARDAAPAALLDAARPLLQRFAAERLTAHAAAAAAAAAARGPKRSAPLPSPSAWRVVWRLGREAGGALRVSAVLEDAAPAAASASLSLPVALRLEAAPRAEGGSELRIERGAADEAAAAAPTASSLRAQLMAARFTLCAQWLRAKLCLDFDRPGFAPPPPPPPPPPPTTEDEAGAAAER